METIGLENRASLLLVEGSIPLPSVFKLIKGIVFR